MPRPLDCQLLHRHLGACGAGVNCHCGLGQGGQMRSGPVLSGHRPHLICLDADSVDRLVLFIVVFTTGPVLGLCGHFSFTTTIFFFFFFSPCRFFSSVFLLAENDVLARRATPVSVSLSVSCSLSLSLCLSHSLPLPLPLPPPPLTLSHTRNPPPPPPTPTCFSLFSYCAFLVT